VSAGIERGPDSHAARHGECPAPRLIGAAGRALSRKRIARITRVSRHFDAARAADDFFKTSALQYVENDCGN
jgi:hypothetical protein